MIIEITDKERDMIVSGLIDRSHRLHDYSGFYKNNLDVENAKDCIKEACKYLLLADKIRDAK